MNDHIVTVEEISPVRKKISFNIPWEKVNQELELAYKRIGNNVKVKGFRPGKVPRSILEKYYRTQSEEETEISLIKHYYLNALVKEGIKAVSMPQIEPKGIERGKDYNFSVIVEVEPEIEPKNYLSLEITREEIEVSEEDIFNRLQEIRQTFATLEDIVEDRSAEIGDFLLVDISGTIDGKYIQGLEGFDQLVEIGGKRFNLPIEEQLIGMKKGDEKTFQVDIPENHPIESARGKKVDMTVKVKGIRIKKLPALDEEFIKNFDKFESLENLKEEIRKTILKERSFASELNMIRQLEQKLLENNTFDVPDALVDHQISLLMSDTRRKMTERGVNQVQIKDFLDKYAEGYREEAVRIIKLMLLTKKIAEKEGIKVEESELEQRIHELADRNRQEYDVLKKYIERNDMIEDLRIEILNKKTYDFLLKNVKFINVNEAVTEQGGVK